MNNEDIEIKIILIIFVFMFGLIILTRVLDPRTNRQICEDNGGVYIQNRIKGDSCMYLRGEDNE